MGFSSWKVEQNYVENDFEFYKQKSEKYGADLHTLQTMQLEEDFP